jgi:23S rRNA (guanosine2251-2'-O)-methyltransferase
MSKYIFGIQAVREAVKANIQINKILVNRELNSQAIKEILGLCRSNKTPVQFVPEDKLNRITNNNHQGIIALSSPIEYYDVEQILLDTIESGKTPLIIVLDGITDVRNLGAIARTAEAAGCQCLLIPESGSAGITPDAIKASAGALNHIPVCRYKHIKDIVLVLRQYGISVVAATERAENIIYDYDFKNPVAIILGDEGKGLSNSSIKLADSLLKLPMFGKIGSLNVSVSAAIITYEAIRQRS